MASERQNISQYGNESIQSLKGADRVRNAPVSYSVPTE